MGSDSGTDNCNDAFKKAAYLLSGFSLLMTLRVGMNGAPFCMKRFKIPEHLFSLYVSRVHNAIELGGFAGVSSGTIYTMSKGFGTQECEKVSIAINWLFFLINVALFFVFVTGGEEGHLTDFYWTLTLSAFLYGMNYVFILQLAGECIVYFLATVYVSGIFVSVYHFIFLKLFGNRRKFNTDYLIITWQIILSIIITSVTSGVWTKVYSSDSSSNGQSKCGVDESSGGGSFTGHVISPMIMCIFAEGIVYVFYPAIAPGLIVDFWYVNKIDQALLIISPIPSIIIAVLDADDTAKKYSPKNEWTEGKAAWHGILIFIPVMSICGYLFIKALHYPHSATSLAIINKPRMAGFLTILFYVSHMILLAVGRPGVEKNSGPAKQYLPVANGFVADLSTVLFIFLSEGYVNEFKKHDRSYWPTQGLSSKRALVFWLDKAIQNAFKNILLIFTRDLRKDLMSALD